MDEFADAGEKLNVDAAAEGRHLVARGPALHVRKYTCEHPKMQPT